MVLETEPDGAALTDQWQIDQWVAPYGSWLAALPQGAGADRHRGVDRGGARSRNGGCGTCSSDARREDAPEFARQVVAERARHVYLGLERAARAGGVDLPDARPRRPQAQRDRAGSPTRDAPGSAVLGICSATGAGVAIPVDAQRLCEIVRVSLRPRSAELLEHARGCRASRRGCEWEDVGPAEAFADYKAGGCYRHDGAVSVTWEMSQAPRGEFHERVLAKLLAPNRYIARKRVTLLYRVIPGGEAVKMVENAVKTAEFRVRTDGRRATARDRLEAEIAKANARDEARGAALTEIGMLVTATVLEEEGLQAAIGAVENPARPPA